MTMDADALLSGPRGRCAALAVASRSSGDEYLDATLGGAVMELAGAYESAGGSSRAYVRFEVDDGIPEATRELPVIRNVDELAAALLDAPMLTGRIQPLDELENAVNSARYWQEPEAEDALAALPVLRPALMRAADALLAHPDTSWWDEPIARSDQWAVEFDFQDGEPSSVQPPDISRFRASALAEENQARQDRSTDPTESISGDWWSTPLVPLASFTTTRSVGDTGPLGLRLVEDSLGWVLARARAVAIAASARVYEIGGADDWAELCRRFPLDVTASRRHDWYRATGRAGDWVIPDWTAVGEHYDGVHLSVAGYLRAAGIAIPVDERTASVVAGWDPDQTWWFRPEVLRISEEAPVSWSLRTDGTGWHRASETGPV